MSKPLRIWSGEPVVIDSSVAFKWFGRDEPGADEAADLLQAHSHDTVALVAPANLPLEIINGLACRGMSAANLEAAVSDLDDFNVLLVDSEPERLTAAARIAQQERLALYDALFIALAAELDAVLVTADRKQATTKSCRVRLLLG